MRLLTNKFVLRCLISILILFNKFSMFSDLGIPGFITLSNSLILFNIRKPTRRTPQKQRREIKRKKKRRRPPWPRSKLRRRRRPRRRRAHPTLTTMIAAPTMHLLRRRSSRRELVLSPTQAPRAKVAQPKPKKSPRRQSYRRRRPRTTQIRARMATTPQTLPRNR